MKKLTKGLILVLCAAVLVAGSIMGTLAWLNDTKEISNTFTVGDIQITLTQNDNMVKKLIPGTKVEMNAKVTVEKGSEECYLFVKVENEISEIQQTIEGQLTANEWKKLNGVANVYYYENAIPTKNEDVPYDVFQSFEIAESASSNDLTGYKNKKIVITAYAVQTSGFTSASQAWEKTFGASNQSQPNDQNSQ